MIDVTTLFTARLMVFLDWLMCVLHRSTSSEADVQQRNLEYDPPRTPSPVLDTNTWPLTADSVDLTEGDRPWTGKRIGGGVDELLELEDKKAMETTSAAAAEPSASTAATDVPQPPADPELPEIP